MLLLAKASTTAEQAAGADGAPSLALLDAAPRSTAAVVGRAGLAGLRRDPQPIHIWIWRAKAKT